MYALASLNRDDTFLFAAFRDTADTTSPVEEGRVRIEFVPWRNTGSSSTVPCLLQNLFFFVRFPLYAHVGCAAAENWKQLTSAILS